MDEGTKLGQQYGQYGHVRSCTAMYGHGRFTKKSGSTKKRVRAMCKNRASGTDRRVQEKLV
ncbi:hypothetical protein F2Q68_00034434 [Brassica cretica]|uniref:Uncharacterized protein n=1 Tax=Brassica cretica TaxID=69181 RepID=A0A8S9H8R3_BRACR|nr:hypothetical protein F2Q68_00034434 [Brassica cretica]